MEMTPRTDLQDNIIHQLKNVIMKSMQDVLINSDNDASLIYTNLVRNGFISISPPLEAPPMMQFLTMDSLRNYRDGRSIKPGNILLNIRKLIETIPEVVTICGALSLWIKLRDIATINISKEQAFAIVALWRNCNSCHQISLNDGFVATFDLFNQYGEPELTISKYNMIIDSLVKIESIELTEGIILLREWISKKYIYDI